MSGHLIQTNNAKYNCKICTNFPSIENQNIKTDKKTKQLKLTFNIKKQIPNKTLISLKSELLAMKENKFRYPDHLSKILTRIKKVSIHNKDGFQSLILTLSGVKDPFWLISQLKFRSLAKVNLLGHEKIKTNIDYSSSDYDLVWDHIIFNMRNPLLQNKVMRQALTISTPRSKVLNNVFMGNATLSEGPLHPQNIFFYPKKPPTIYNIEKAKNLLQSNLLFQQQVNKNKINNKYPNLEILVINRKRMIKIARLVSLEWSRLGISTSIKVSKYNNFKKLVEKRHFSGVVILSIKLNPLRPLFHFFHSNQIPVSTNRYRGFNLSSWINPIVDVIMEKSLFILRHQERRLLMKDFQKIYHEDYPSIPLSFRKIAKKQ